MLGEIRRIMSGEREPTRHEYTRARYSLNERYRDLGQDIP